MDFVGLRTGRNGFKHFGPVAGFFDFFDFCISNSPSKMTKPEVLGILGLDVGDNWAQGCLLESCRPCLGHMMNI